MKRRHWLAVTLLGVAAGLLLLWLARAYIAAQYARSYFQDHGVAAAVEIGDLGLSGVSGRFALGPAGAPDVSAERIELRFDPLRWMPYVVEVRLVNPVVRAGIGPDGKVTLGSLQGWIDSLSRQQGKSQFVSDDLTVSLTGLRALLATPAGAVEADGDVRLVRNVPVSVRLHMLPATLTWHGATLALGAASLDYEGHRAALRVSGNLHHAAADVRGADAALDLSGLRWSAHGLSAASAQLQAGALAANLIVQPKLTVSAHDLAMTGTDLRADLDVTASGGLHADMAALRAHDPALAKSLAANLARLELGFVAHVSRQGKLLQLQLTAPLLVKGAQGAVLRVAALNLSGSSDSLTAAFDATLNGSRLPAVKVSINDLVWSGGGFTAHAGVDARFSYAMLHDAQLAANGVLSWQSGRYAFTPEVCGRVSLTAFHPGASDLAKDIHASICPAGGAPLVAGAGAQWKFTGMARDAQAFLPLANSQIDQASGRLAFEGQGADFHGAATQIGGRVSDKAAAARFKPLLGSGAAALDAGVWHGDFAMSSEKNNPLGQVTFQHVLATGAGSAHISAAHLAFTQAQLQPEHLSALLVAFRKAEGVANFQGDVSWTRDAITSRGTLAIDSLDFLTPLGRAHAIKTKIEFTSLLPPQTAENQQISISTIDWTLPFSGVDLRFSFNPATVKVNALSSGWAEGKASLGAFTIDLANPAHVSGTAQLDSITLNSLITASNLGSKLKLAGRISGRIPFSIGPDGLRITNGHIASDGAGRLSVDRSLWMQGDAAISSNAVQDFAYQALENLAFDSMSADLNSVAGGRLQVVFHIKGRSDPPKPQTADVAITDILNGTALYKPIALPSGTPIDLTLDTSLNFDELLKSYTEAWSKSLSPEGHPDAGH